MWNRLILMAAIVMLAALPAAAAQVQREPPSAPYKKVSTLVKLPDFLPGIGTLYVDPNTLPAGPFLAYDHKGRLVSTIYMIPLKDMDGQKAFPDLARARRQGGSCQPLLQRRSSGRRGAALPHCALARPQGRRGLGREVGRCCRAVRSLPQAGARSRAVSLGGAGTLPPRRRPSRST